MTEDRYTNTPEDAAAFERSRAIDAGEDDRPSRAELAREAAEDDLQRRIPYTQIWGLDPDLIEPDPDLTCAQCGRELMPSEGWLCTDCEEHDR